VPLPNDRHLERIAFSMQVVSEGSMLRERMSEAQSVLVLTGAGVSAESGVPTFRGGGNTAVWKGMPFDVISSAGMLQRDLPAVWEWFNYRRNLLTTLQPNAAHRTIATWQERFFDLSLVTQNIDGLHQAAGSRDVIELHGNIWRGRCFDCDARYDLKDIRMDDDVPSCFDCGGNLRPDVVLFGEMLPPGAFERAAVKRHPAIPQFQDFQRMPEIISEIVEQDVADPAAEDDPQCGVEHQVVGVAAAHWRTGLLQQLEQIPIADEDADEICQAVPTQIEAPDMQGDWRQAEIGEGGEA